MSPDRNRSTSAPPAGGTILPLLASDANQRVLTELMEDRYDIVSAEPGSIGDVDFDLCIVDDRSLAEHRQVLAETKERHATGFLPYLLVTRRQDASDISPRVQEAVDEILTVPTTSAVLSGRIANLLKRRQSEERFRQLFQAAPDPVVVVSPDGFVSNANRAFCRTFGFDEREFGQARFTELEFSRQDPDEDADPDRDSHTLSWDQNDGTTLLMELHVSPVERNGTVFEWIGIFRDITTSTKRIEGLEQERQRLNGMHWSRT